jgi:hypothetical protein
MLWFLRKVFGVIALVWVILLLLCLIGSLLDPKISAVAFLGVVFTSYVGAPAGIIWAVLKVISVLSTPSVAQPAPVAAWHPPSQVSTPSVLGLSTPTVLPQAKHTEPSRTLPPGEPEVYTYSAPGMPMCPTCGKRPVVFYCSTHKSAVCLECVARHDEAGQCVYVPAFRTPKPAVIP